MINNSRFSRTQTWANLKSKHPVLPKPKEAKGTIKLYRLVFHNQVVVDRAPYAVCVAKKKEIVVSKTNRDKFKIERVQ